VVDDVGEGRPRGGSDEGGGDCAPRGDVGDLLLRPTTPRRIPRLVFCRRDGNTITELAVFCVRTERSVVGVVGVIVKVASGWPRRELEEREKRDL